MDCLDDGDDIAVIIEEESLGKFSSLIRDAFVSMGMDMKMDAPSRSIYGVEFCQCKVVEFRPNQFKFVRSYLAVMSKSLCGVRNWENISFRRKVILAIGTCELMLGLGVPVLQSYAMALIRNSGKSREGVNLSLVGDGLRARALRDSRLVGPMAKLSPQTILPCARHSFAEAFGLEWHEQIRLEHFLDNWEFNVDATSNAEGDWDPISWTGYRSFTECYPVME
jgi:hypothetical protein